MREYAAWEVDGISPAGIGKIDLWQRGFPVAFLGPKARKENDSCQLWR